MKKASVFLNSLIIVLIISLTGCSTNTETVNENDFKETIISTSVFNYEDEDISQMFLDNEENISYYYEKHNSQIYPVEHYGYNIIEDEKWNPVLSEKIKSYVPGIEENVVWYETLTNMQNQSISYIIYSSPEENNDSIFIMHLDENENLVYNIDTNKIFVSDILERSIFILENENICIAEIGYENKEVIIINPHTKSIISSFEYDFYPQMVVGDNLIGISGKGDEVVVMNLSSGEIVNRISTELNSESEYTYGGHYSWETNLDICANEKNIYMVNKNGIFKAKLDGEKFENILSSDDTKYIGEINKYEGLLNERFNNYNIQNFIDTNDISYEIFVKSQSEIYINVKLLDGGGVGYMSLFFEYELE